MSGNDGRGRHPVSFTLCPQGGRAQTTHRAAAPRFLASMPQEGFQAHSGEAPCRPMTSDHLASNPITRRVREFAGRVRQVQERDLYLYLEPVQAIGGPRVTIEGRSVLLGSSYSYLGLLGHPEIEAASRAAVQHYGTGTHGVRLLAGNTDLHDRLEARIASFVGAPAAVAYSSGYVANVAVISTVSAAATSSSATSSTTPALWTDACSPAPNWSGSLTTTPLPSTARWPRPPRGRARSWSRMPSSAWTATSSISRRWLRSPGATAPG